MASSKLDTLEGEAIRYPGLLSMPCSVDGIFTLKAFKSFEQCVIAFSLQNINIIVYQPGE